MYGIIVSFSILIASWYAEKEAQYKKLDIDLLWNLIFWAVIGAIVGARLFHVIDYWEYYRLVPLEAIKVWKGGLGILGGLMGGMVAIMVFARTQKIGMRSLLPYFDLAGISLPLGQFIGRWANFVNNEVYGLPTTLPWAITIPLDKRLPGYEGIETYHPLFLYESALNLLAFFVLFSVRHSLKDKLKIVDGDIFLLYLFSYGTIRLVIESFKIETFEISGVNIASAVSTLMILSSVLLIFLRRFNERKSTKTK